MLPNFGLPSNTEYPTAAAVQQNTPLLGAQPTDQTNNPLATPPMGGMMAGNQVQPQQPMQLGVPSHVANMVQALKGTQ